MYKPSVYPSSSPLPLLSPCGGGGGFSSLICCHLASMFPNKNFLLFGAGTCTPGVQWWCVCIPPILCAGMCLPACPLMISLHVASLCACLWCRWLDTASLLPLLAFSFLLTTLSLSMCACIGHVRAFCLFSHCCCCVCHVMLTACACAPLPVCLCHHH